MTTYMLYDRSKKMDLLQVEAEGPREGITKITPVEGSEGIEEFVQKHIDAAEGKDFKPTPVGLARLLGVLTSIRELTKDEGGDMGARETIQRMRKQREEEAEVNLGADGDISKIDEDQRLVFGWAYVTHDKDGTVNIDKSGDFIDNVAEIEKSAYDFVLKSRAGDDMHTNVQTSTLVESIVFTPEKIEKMGIAAGSVPLGWWVGFKIEDDKVWDRVKKGELKAFSIHGKGTREKVDPDSL